MNRLDCQLVPPEASGAPKGAEITVGTIFHLNCQGAESLAEGTTWSVESDPADKYIVNVLGQTREGSKWSLEVTSYRAGDHKLENLMLKASDGSQWQAGPVAFTVASVLDPMEPPEKPYGPMGPLDVGIPVAWVMGLLVVVLGLGTAFIVKVVARLQRRRFLDALRSRAPIGGALHEVHRRLRHLQRNRILFAGKEAPPGEALDVVRELDQILVEYLEQRFEIPLHGKPWPTAHKNLAKLIPAARRDQSEALRRLGKEIKTALVADRVAPKDAIQLTEQLRQVVEALDIKAEKRP